MIFTSHDGTLLNSQSLLAQQPKGTLLVVHGLGEHMGRYESFAEDWLARGYSVHRMDLRGHGSSGGQRGHVDSFSDYYKDLEAWVRHLENADVLTGDVPCYLVGHSLGGLIATGFLSSRTTVSSTLFSGLILSAPAFGMPGGLLLKAEEFLVKYIPPLLSRLQIPNGINPNLLSHDIAVVDAYKEDPLVHGWVTPAFAHAIFETMGTLNKKALAARSPLLVLLPGEDKVVSSKATEQFLNKVRASHPQLPVTLKRFPGSYHEIFNESVRDKAFAVMEEWIQQCSQLPEISRTPKTAKSVSSKSSKPRATAKESSR